MELDCKASTVFLHGQLIFAQRYSKVRVLGDDSSCRLPKVRVPGTSRLKLLRRTLRERRALANMVREVHIPDFQALYLTASIEREEIVNLVASLVMACPNLERLVGFHIPFTHSFNRLSHALSTRTALKERVWVLANALVEEDENETDSSEDYYHAACDPMERFLELNSNHGNLSTLVINQESAQPAIDLTYRAIVGTIRKLPALRHLSLSGLSASSFSNLALNSLPSNLQSLRLENLPGINDKGLRRLSTSSIITSLESLVLVDLEVCDLDVLAGFLSPHMPLLKSFSLSQHIAPDLCTGFRTPVFLSSTLERIHWELRSQVDPPLPPASLLDVKSGDVFPFPNDEPVTCLATNVLAASIEEGNLPALKRIRAPHDPQGTLQALCKPLGNALLRSDLSFFTTVSRSVALGQNPGYVVVFSSETDKTRCSILTLISVNLEGYSPWISSCSDEGSTYSLKQFLSTAPGERTDSVIESPSSMSLSSHDQETWLAVGRTPVRSRLAAQARIVAARRNPYMAVKIVDPLENIRLEKTIGGFLGNLKSEIVYDLRPDRNREAADEYDEDAHEWLTGIDDVTGEWEAGPSYGGGCSHGGGGKAGRVAVEVKELFF